MRILLTKGEVLRYSKQYDYGDGDDRLAKRLEQAVGRGFMTRGDLVAVAKWKWRGGRTRQLAEQNSEDEVKEISCAAFAAKSERLRIGALLSLRGVCWPMASVILHFAFPDRYPILDRRAMNTVGGSTNYTFDTWMEYTKLCRKTIQQMGIQMRTLDRALWTADKSATNAAK
jgi:hypothetical protein